MLVAIILARRPQWAQWHLMDESVVGCFDVSIE